MIDRLRPIWVAPGQVGRAWAEALNTPDWESRAEILKRDDRVIVLRARFFGSEYVVKRWRLSPGARVKSLFRASRAFRHWRGARWLARHGFRTAACYAIVRGMRDADPVEMLAMESLPAKSVLHHLADDDLTVREEHALARALGRMLLRLNQEGRYNRDGKPSNLIVTRAGNDPEIAIIDCAAINRLPIWEDPCEPQMSRARLLIEPTGVGLKVRRSLRMSVLRAARNPDQAHHEWRLQRRADWERTATLIAGHADPTPRIDPLATPVSQ